jgi:hypothetical protein
MSLWVLDEAGLPNVTWARASIPEDEAATIGSRKKMSDACHTLSIHLVMSSGTTLRRR